MEPHAPLLKACADKGTMDSKRTPDIHRTFLEKGSSNHATGNGLPNASLAGARFGSPKTLAFFTRNGKQQALVQIPLTLAAGTAGALYSIAQQMAAPVALASGTQLAWTLLGDQLQFAVA